jgi:hypothetical protein
LYYKKKNTQDRKAGTTKSYKCNEGQMKINCSAGDKRKFYQTEFCLKHDIHTALQCEFILSVGSKLKQNKTKTLINQKSSRQGI